MDLKNFKSYYYLRSSVIRNQKETKAIPVYVRFQSGKTRKDFSTKIYGDVNLWSKDFKRFQPIDANHKRINQKLDEFEKRVEYVYWEVVKSNGEFDLSDFLKGLFDVRENHVLVDVFEARLQQLEMLIGSEYTQSTITTYRVALRHLKDYLRKEENLALSLENFNVGVVRGYFEYLRTKMSNNSANKYMRKLRAVINFAIENEWIDHNPCSAFKLRDKKVDRLALTKEELNVIEEKEITVKRLEIIKDLFLFQCYTGLAFHDMKDLKVSDIIQEGDKKYLVKNRKKTDVQSIIPILPEVETLIEKYSGLDGEVLLPVPSNQKMNAYLKEIGILCGLQKELTSHLGRHTFATLNLNKGVGLDYLQAMMGMTSAKHLKVYAKMKKETLYDLLK